MSTVITASTSKGSSALLLGTGLILFLANAGMLVLQLLAGRYLAPFIGSSVETWTSVIGVFLTGIALGNWLGGKIADRYPSTRTLALLLFLGAASSLTMLGGSMYAEQSGFYKSIALAGRIPLLTFLFCLLPAFFLSLLTPLAIKLALPDVTKAGRVAGLMFALSTLGCLLGNYLTGFWFMAEYTLNTISFGVAVSLFVLSFLLLLFGNVRVDSASGESSEIASKLVPEPDGNSSDFRDNIRVAYVIVFLASFCGMSLELTGSRVLAPVLGVSLYSWTGIIGVMLAGTATGNYLGGVMADRGPVAAMRGFGLLFMMLIGFCIGPSAARLLGDSPADPQNPETWIWIRRVLGLIGGILIAGLGIIIGQSQAGRRLNTFVVGGGIGAALAYTLTRQICRILDREEKGDAWRNLINTIQDWSEQVGYNLEPFVIQGGAFLIFGLLALWLLWHAWGEGQERPDRRAVLSTCLVCAGGTSLLVLASVGFMHHFRFMNELELIEKILVWTFALFYLPMMFLGTISPQVIRLSVKDVQHAGRTAGNIYAVSTVGAIVGTFVTGYFLIGLIGSFKVLMLISLLLAALGMFAGELWKNNSWLYGISIVLGGAITGLLLINFGKDPDRIKMETKYYTIAVSESEKEGRRVRYLVLDHLTHSYVDMDDVLYLGYKHEEVQGELLRLANDRQPGCKLLVIGGGGYTFPRWAEKVLPEVHVDVVEIDPGVTEIAYQALGLDRNTKIQTHNMDGRQFVMEKAQKGSYALVMQDAVNDLSVPYHLLTKEYNEGVKELLTKDGAYLLTFIDNLQDGELWRAAAHTMRKTFKYVYLLGSDDRFDYEYRAVYILYGSDQPFDVNAVRQAVHQGHRGIGAIGGGGFTQIHFWTHLLDDAGLDALLEKGKTIILTDQYAPTDNLMSTVFRDRERNRR